MTLAQGEPRGRVFAEILGDLVFGLLARHPVVAMTEPDDRQFLDGSGFTLDANHPELGNLLAWELGTARRDEVLWLELTLVPGASAMPRLHCRSSDGGGGVHTGGGGTFSGGLTGAVAAWLDARYLAPASGSITIRPAIARAGMTASSSVPRQSSINRVRVSRNHARKRMIAGFANSDGCSDIGPSRIQRWVLWERSRKNTSTSSSVVSPSREKTTAGCL